MSQRSGSNSRFSGLRTQIRSLSKNGSKELKKVDVGSKKSRNLPEISPYGDTSEGRSSVFSTHIKRKSAFDALEKPLTNINVKNKKYVRRIIDCGNPRYQASRASSIVGGLLNGKLDKRALAPEPRFDS